MLSYIVSDPDRTAFGSDALGRLAEALTSQFDLPALQVELSLATSEEIRDLNLSYRQLDEPTDVLSFPLFASLEEILSLPAGIPVLLGSVIVCPEKAAAYGESLIQLAEHGALHLLGFDHVADPNGWRKAERPLLAALAAQGIEIPEVPEA